LPHTEENEKKSEREKERELESKGQLYLNRTETEREYCLVPTALLSMLCIAATGTTNAKGREVSQVTTTNTSSWEFCSVPFLLCVP
jgi:hypothetical protein